MKKHTTGFDLSKICAEHARDLRTLSHVCVETALRLVCMTLITSISLESVQSLEEIFSYLTPDGWVVPAWLTALREHVMAMEQSRDLTMGAADASFAHSLEDHLVPRTYH